MIYLDGHASTPLDPRVLDEMMPYLTGRFGNASSADHRYGHEAAAAVEAAREQVARAINARPSEIIFTGGATESDNMAITGAMYRYAGRGDHLITCSTEHEAVLETARHLERAGRRVTYLPVDENGTVDPGALEEAVTDDTVMISIMAANNEIGTIADLDGIGRIADRHGVLFHTDAAQAAGRIPLDVRASNISLMSVSSHKMYGPKGVGALYVRGMRPRVALEPQTHGGGQERGMRPGTLNVPGIVGFGCAAGIAVREMGKESGRFKEWSRAMMESFADGAGGRLNGHPEDRLAGNLNVRFPGVEAKAVINSVSDRIAISAGSACTADSVEPSHVLLAIGLTAQEAHSSVRIGMGRFNTEGEITEAAEGIVEAVRGAARLAAG